MFRNSFYYAVKQKVQVFLKSISSVVGKINPGFIDHRLVPAEALQTPVVGGMEFHLYRYRLKLKIGDKLLCVVWKQHLLLDQWIHFFLVFDIGLRLL